MEINTNTNLVNIFKTSGNRVLVETEGRDLSHHRDAERDDMSGETGEGEDYREDYDDL